MKYFKGRDTTFKTEKGKGAIFRFDKARFNWKHPRIKVFTNHHNPITEETVFVELGLKASIEFSASEKQEFKVVMAGNVIKTVGEPPVDCGVFTLKKKNGG